MALTSAQKATVAAYILADPVLSLKPHNSDGDFDIAIALNQLASPNFIVWTMGALPVAFSHALWDWTRVDNLSVGKARILDYMIAAASIDLNRATVRAGVNSAFSVTVADAPCRNAIWLTGSRSGSIVEKLLVTSGAGIAPTDLGVGPGVLGFVGPIGQQDVHDAREGL